MVIVLFVKVTEDEWNCVFSVIFLITENIFKNSNYNTDDNYKTLSKYYVTYFLQTILFGYCAIILNTFFEWNELHRYDIS